MARLLLDGMLGRLCTWCRVLGIDTVFSTTATDTEMLERAKGEDRILVTMDRELVERCAKNKIRCVSIASKKTEEQIAQIIKETGVPIDFPNDMLCPACNGGMKEAIVEDVRGSVPEDAQSKSPRFWKCVSCGKVYWEGSHWRNMLKFYEKVSALL